MGKTSSHTFRYNPGRTHVYKAAETINVQNNVELHLLLLFNVIFDAN